MSKEISHQYVSQAAQQFVMMLQLIEERLEIEIPNADITLTAEDEEYEWVIAVTKKKVEAR